jgi:hypothetical protein
MTFQNNLCYIVHLTKFIREPLPKGRILMLVGLGEEASVGRPALAFKPIAAVDSPLPGRLFILSILRSPTPGSNTVRQRTLVAVGPAPNATLTIAEENHDNDWFLGNGVALLFEDGVDSNLRAAIATALVEKGIPQPHKVVLRPKADGIADFTQRNWNDWEGLGVDLCRVLVGSVGGNLKCPDWPFP